MLAISFISWSSETVNESLRSSAHISICQSRILFIHMQAYPKDTMSPKPLTQSLLRTAFISVHSEPMLIASEITRPHSFDLLTSTHSAPLNSIHARFSCGCWRHNSTRAIYLGNAIRPLTSVLQMTLYWSAGGLLLLMNTGDGLNLSSVGTEL